MGNGAPLCFIIMHGTIHENSGIEELIETFPGMVAFLGEKGLRCIVCGEPVWGTLGDLARSKGWSASEIEGLVME